MSSARNSIEISRDSSYVCGRLEAPHFRKGKLGVLELAIVEACAKFCPSLYQTWIVIVGTIVLFSYTELLEHHSEDLFHVSHFAFPRDLSHAIGGST